MISGVYRTLRQFKMPRQKKEQLITKAIRLLNAGKSQKDVAKSCGVSLRTISRWVSERSDELQDLKSQERAIIQSDPMVLAVADIRAQVQQILDYRDSQRSFAVEMGQVVERATRVLLIAVEALEEQPDQLTARAIPQLLRAVVDAAEKVSNAWGRATGLDDLLENLNEPKTIVPGSKEA
jgi:transcriptional regulator with XRE-family HTH domain